MDIVRRVQYLKAEDLIRGIRDIGYQINLESSISLIKDFKME